MASLGGKRTLSLAVVNYLRSQHWLDRHTAGVTLEFVLYNADVNLGCLVRVLWEFPPGGGAQTDVHVNSLRFYRSTSTGLYIFVLIFELLYVCYTLYMIIHELKLIRQRKLRYLQSFSGCIDLSACILSVVVIGLYVTFLVKVSDLMSRYKQRQEIVGYFHFLTRLDVALANSFGFLAVIGMLKFLHILRFNPLIWRFMMVLKYGMSKLICTACILAVCFVAFGSFMYIVGGKSIENYSTISKSLATLYEGLLGNIYLDDLEQIHSSFGPFLYIAFIVVSTILVFNLNIIVLMSSVRHVSKHPVPNEDAEILWMLVYKFVQYLGIKLRTH